ncbi:NUDIX domain-containing protein [Metabacillus indicus]
MTCGSDSLKDRGSVVLIVKNKVGLIKRTRKGSVYYVFPGGGIEKGETPEEGAKREALEELGVEVKIGSCLAEVAYGGTQYFFKADIIGGTFGTGQGAEYTDKDRDRGTYLPIWLNKEELLACDVRPKEVVSRIESLLR